MAPKKTRPAVEFTDEEIILDGGKVGDRWRMGVDGVMRLVDCMGRVKHRQKPTKRELVRIKNGLPIAVRGRGVGNGQKPKSPDKDLGIPRDRLVPVKDEIGHYIWIPSGWDPDGKLPKVHDGFSVTLANSILKEVLEGKSLSKICDADYMPSRSSLYLWRSKYPEFDEALQKAKEFRAHMKAEDLEDMVDKANTKFDLEKAKARINALQWLISKHASEDYGNKEDKGNANIQINFITGVPDGNSK